MEEMPMHLVPLAVMDYFGPALGALLFVAAMSFVAEPTRRTLNAIILAGASGVYLSGGVGAGGVVLPALRPGVGVGAGEPLQGSWGGGVVYAAWGVAPYPRGGPF